MPRAAPLERTAWVIEEIGGVKFSNSDETRRKRKRLCTPQCGYPRICADLAGLGHLSTQKCRWLRPATKASPPAALQRRCPGAACAQCLVDHMHRLLVRVRKKRARLLDEIELLHLVTSRRAERTRGFQLNTGNLTVRSLTKEENPTQKRNQRHDCLPKSKTHASRT